MPSVSEDLPPPSSAAITLPSADTQAIGTMLAVVQQGANTAVVPLNSVPASVSIPFQLNSQQSTCVRTANAVELLFHVRKSRHVQRLTALQTTSQAVRELPAWKKLPPEVRMMIFRKLGRGYFNSKNHTTMPAVMLAFEGVQEDYAILWEIFFDLDVYKVKLGTTKTFASMTKKEAQLVKNVRITEPPWNYYDATMTGNVESSRRFCRQFKLGTNIRRVEFAACQDMKGAANAIRLITEFPFWLEGFPALEFLSVEICSPGDIFDSAAEQKLFKGFIKRIAKKVKVVGKRSEERKYKNFGYIVGFEAPWNEQEILPNEHFEGEWKSREVLGEVREWVWKAGRRQTM